LPFLLELGRFGHGECFGIKLSQMMELKSVFDSLGSACCSIALPAADFCSGGAWAILVCLKFSFGLQLFFNEARPACILCFAIAENVFYQLPGSISKKKLTNNNNNNDNNKYMSY
jgi:hypothetical protein